MDAAEREEAIEAIARPFCRNREGAICGPCREQASEALDQLTSPRTVECETCDGRGWVMSEADQGEGWETVKSPCEPCSGSGRIEKGPIAYLAADLERVGIGDRFGLLAQLTPTHAMSVAAQSSQPLNDGEDYGGWFDVFRIVPDESPKGGA